MLTYSIYCRLKQTCLCVYVRVQVCDEGSDSEDLSHFEQEEDDEEEGKEVYGITSVINLSHHKVRCALLFRLQCFTPILEYGIARVGTNHFG